MPRGDWCNQRLVWAPSTHWISPGGELKDAGRNPTLARAYGELHTCLTWHLLGLPGLWGGGLRCPRPPASVRLICILDVATCLDAGRLWHSMSLLLSLEKAMHSNHKASRQPCTCSHFTTRTSAHKVNVMD